MLNGAKTMMDVCFINININIYMNINKTHIHHCVDTIENFLARMDMKNNEVCTEFNFLLIQMIKTKLYIVKAGTYKQNLEFQKKMFN